MNRRKKLLYRSAATLPFRPTDIPGLLTWWDGADVSTLFTGTYADRLISTTNPTTNLDPLCRQEDKSGNGRHRYCNADATRPTYALSATLNGRTGCNLGRWDRPSLSAAVKTWFVVHKYDGTTPVYGSLVSNQSTFTGLAISSTTSWRLSFVRDNVAIVDSGFTQGTSARIYKVIFKDSPVAAQFETIASGVPTVRSTIASAGVAPAGAAFTNMPGQEYESFAYDSELTSPQLNAVVAYLYAKWGV